ncbi:hypothetical protein CU254_41825 (plasmid) [Amycolatopsis sp. AA4]|uniref:hypothetical protein n=1 Tax=Actinomycetes TaxID=1760 RepID=UPI0001B57143|nr:MULTISPECIES: hypothetical protein [Actinomycetes]ATY17119.1 hypothetical protein CU254_41825 [Amycolatopsis sp. AA4]EFL12648.1 predicted protein [Streptomyces sp. AA4]
MTRRTRRSPERARSRYLVANAVFVPLQSLVTGALFITRDPDSLKTLVAILTVVSALTFALVVLSIRADHRAGRQHRD